MTIFGFYFLYILGGGLVATLLIDAARQKPRQDKPKEEKIDDSDYTE